MVRISKTTPTEIRKIYLYKLNSDKIVEYVGELHKYGFSRWMYRGPGLISEVASEPGTIFRRSVWFDEPNLEKAKELFIEYEQKLILSAKRKIETSKETIENIRKM